jgi:hypothetical protein
MQAISTVARFLIIGLMFITALISILTDSPLRPVIEDASMPAFSLRGMGVSISIIGFAAGYNIVVPSLVTLMEDKKGALAAQFWANVVITIFLLCVGIVVGYALLGTAAPS